MPSLVPNHEYDIFISYRQKDNRSDKWVTSFVKALREEIDATFKEDISIYFDENPHDGLLETHHVNKSLEGKLKSLIFIPIISQTYCDPKSFAWQHEFCTFNKLATESELGRDIKLSNGNVASRILPVKIHDLDADDKALIENELGGVLRPIEFIFRSPGVNRPLTSRDDDAKEITHTLFYRDQINKLANAIKELLQGLKHQAGHKKDDLVVPKPVAKQEARTEKRNPSANRQKESVSTNSPVSKKKVLVIAISILVIAGLAYGANEIRLRMEGESTIVKIEQLAREIEELSSIERGTKAWEAYQLVRQVEEFPGLRASLVKTWLPISRTFSVKTDPPGAQVYIKPYSTPTTEWTLIGQSPIDSIRLPFGSLRIRIEKEGYASQDDAVAARIAYDLMAEVNLSYSLLEPSQVPEGMVLAKGDSVEWYGTNEPYGDFFIDRFEVTNKAYKQFLDAGGYDQKNFWQHEFIKDSRVLNWEEAMAMFIDKTGQLGPSGWIAGSYPEGHEDYPVGGVSWYEAAAYAEYAGKTLPTIFHFRNLSMPWANAEILSQSNIQGNGPGPVGAATAMTRFGTRDLAGNVAEWVFNAVQATGNRLIPGGAWSDDHYVYLQDLDLSPFTRSELNGFRCMKARNDQPIPASLVQPVLNFKFDMSMRKLINDEQFELVKRLYDYEPSPIAARTEYRRDEGSWVKEKINFLPAYGKDSMTVYLFLPKNSKPPYHPVVYYPGGGAFSPALNEQYIEDAKFTFDFVVKTGRAVIFPVYYSTLERFDPAWLQTSFDKPREGKVARKDITVKIGKDFRRSVDYLASRADMDIDNLGYLGISQGGGEGAIMMAIDNRIKTGVLIVSGLSTRIEVLPEIDRANYCPRVKQPVLMLNSLYDWNYPYDISQKPFFDLLGTPEEHKKLILYKESGHQVPWNSAVKESLSWYDHYLGKVTTLTAGTSGN